MDRTLIAFREHAELGAETQALVAADRFAKVANALILLIPILVLCGWVTGNEILKRVLPGLVEMNPMSAVNFILLGGALAITQWRSAPAWARSAATVFCLLVGLFGLRLLCHYLFHWETNLDRLFFREAMGTNRMAPNTAANFFFVSLALLLIDVRLRSGQRPAEWLALLAAFVAMLAMIGYGYQVGRLIGIGRFVPMALHVAFCFVLFSLALFAIRPRDGIAARVTSSGTGGVMLRQILFWIVAVPLLLGWLILSGYRAGAYDAAFGCTLLVVLVIAFVSLMIWHNAGSLDRKELERRHADEALQRAHAELETRVAERTADLSQILGEISGGIVALGSFAKEIVGTATQLAEGASQTTTALIETTTTIEEVRQTSQLTSRKAQEVAASAQAAADISTTGTRATAEMRTGTEEIRQQMEAIAQSMVWLTEQSHAISEIIAAVEGLSQQAHVLSVNAAIEAARAGEHGRGFAVVAQSVKYLADQSKAATAQVRTILNDIQKATHQTALITEQGSRAVATGVQRSEQASQAIFGLAESIHQAAHTATEIAAASSEYLFGIEQTAEAMQHIKTASTQNLASATQMKTLAQKLDQLGLDLKNMAGRYRI